MAALSARRSSVTRVITKFNNGHLLGPADVHTHTHTHTHTQRERARFTYRSLSFFFSHYAPGLLVEIGN
jgi:hypothetical protein